MAKVEKLVPILCSLAPPMFSARDSYREFLDLWRQRKVHGLHGPLSTEHTSQITYAFRAEYVTKDVPKVCPWIHTWELKDRRIWAFWTKLDSNSTFRRQRWYVCHDDRCKIDSESVRAAEGLGSLWRDQWRVKDIFDRARYELLWERRAWSFVSLPSDGASTKTDKHRQVSTTRQDLDERTKIPRSARQKHKA